MRAFVRRPLRGGVVVFWALSLDAACSDTGSTPQGSASPVAGSAGSTSAAAGSAGAGSPGSGGSATGGSAQGNGGSPSDAGTAGAAEVAGAAGMNEPVPSGPLAIYWIDVEGGAATILAAPDGQTVVVDAGFPGSRDAQRIAQVLKDEVHATSINYFITTHYHTDHVGGVPALAGLIPIEHFYDHGDTVQPGNEYDQYLTTAGDKRTVAKPGDKLTLGDLLITFVTSAGEVIEPPLPPGDANPLCDSATTKTDSAGAENPMSLGFLANFGKFKFVDLGDLTWNYEVKLTCPVNRVGVADIWQVDHHGQDISSAPQLVYALAPTVAVMNNGASKGGAAAAFDIIKASPGLQDLWSMHQVTDNDAAHNAAPDLTANLSGGPDEAHWLKAVIEPNGAYTLTNSRNGTTRTYASR